MQAQSDTSVAGQTLQEMGDKRHFVSLANVSEGAKNPLSNQNNSSNVLKSEPQLQPRPIQQIQHQPIQQQAQIITMQDEKGNQTQQVVYQVS